ncbi:hypothetical protein jhhlp_001767 [Lomentospora prolificans]|uniref:Nephrocystin 3-like N-terminal domain-containing protein n=1 Tax=Lomentospora prolificans TaxID=41688 RepID=A0A2N3NGM5_9PEZI|nr:hypothetical protein jhhlp_001767 [Lomentospora prolificans]
MRSATIQQVYSSLETLHPPGKAEGTPEADIILVPGLGGDYIRTWQATDKEKTEWPKRFLPKNLPVVRVLSFKYTTTLKGTTSTAGLRDHARDLFRKLFDEREDDKFATLRPIIFVGHSLGGMIVKQAMTTANRDKIYGSLWDASRGAMFFSTPHHGMDKSHWKEFTRHILQCDAPGRGVQPTGRMLKQVYENSDTLWKITEEFKPLKSSLEFVTFIESKPMKGVGHVFVDKGRGLMHGPEEQHRYLEGDHVSICKFRKDEELQFEPVRNGIAWLMKQTPKAIDRVGDRGKLALYSLCSDRFHSFLLNKTPTTGTCEWINERRQIKAWLDDTLDKRKLWISGGPACGKSFLARHIITDLIPSSSKEAVHCFLSDSVVGRDDLSVLLRATLHQALRLVPELITEHLLRLFEQGQSLKIKDQEIWTEEILKRVWPDVMAKVTVNHSLVVVVDGFTEMKKEHQQGWFDCFERFQEKAHDLSKVRLLHLSREHPQISLEISRLDSFERYAVKDRILRKI